MSTALLPLARIASRIFELRGRRIILDADLAGIYGVTTKRLNEAVKRNQERFPEDFVFQLERQEVENLRSQIATFVSAAQLDEMKQLVAPPEPPRKRIGFGVAESRGVYLVKRGQSLPNRRRSS